MRTRIFAHGQLRTGELFTGPRSTRNAHIFGGSSTVNDRRQEGVALVKENQYPLMKVKVEKSHEGLLGLKLGIGGPVFGAERLLDIGSLVKDLTPPDPTEPTNRTNLTFIFLQTTTLPPNDRRAKLMRMMFSRKKLPSSMKAEPI